MELHDKKSKLQQAAREELPAQEATGASAIRDNANPVISTEAEVTAAVQRLWRTLQVAAEYDPAQPDHGRKSAIAALVGIMEFLPVLFPQAWTLPVALQELLQGLVDLDKGTVIPLLTPAPTNGRAPMPLSEELFRAIGAAAMTVLVDQGGMDRNRASRDIARRLSKLGYAKGEIKAVTVQKWRERVMEMQEGSPAAKRYQLALDWVKDKSPSEAVNFLFACLPDLNPESFRKKPGS